MEQLNMFLGRTAETWGNLQDGLDENYAIGDQNATDQECNELKNKMVAWYTKQTEDEAKTVGI
jgi:plasmid maintenance system antidote protein VapI